MQCDFNMFMWQIFINLKVHCTYENKWFNANANAWAPWNWFWARVNWLMDLVPIFGPCILFLNIKSTAWILSRLVQSLLYIKINWLIKSNELVNQINSNWLIKSNKLVSQIKQTWGFQHLTKFTFILKKIYKKFWPK